MQGSRNEPLVLCPVCGSTNLEATSHQTMAIVPLLGSDALYYRCENGHIVVRRSFPLLAAPHL